MCLAPCFKGCTDEEYGAEVRRVRNYFDSGGQSLQRELSLERDAASSNLEFENAAALHARVEKLAPVLSQLPEIVHRLDKLTGVMVQPSFQAEAVGLFRIDSGFISDAITFPIQTSEHAKSQSMEARVQESLAAVAAGHAKSALETMEHLAILKRWYYRSSRAGEIFFADEKAGLPMRRIVRGIGRVYRGEAPESTGEGVKTTIKNGISENG